VIITEIGGTVGDIESLPFVEAVRQLQWELPDENCAVIHVALVPYLSAAQELKTKPTQHSVRMLQQNGVHADVIVCRTEHPLSQDMRRKVALFCNVRPKAVIEALDAKSIYEVPLNMMRERLDEIILGKLEIKGTPPPDFKQWNTFLDKLFHPKDEIDIALVGKYVELQDAYKSILESFIHAGAANECKVRVHYVHSEQLDANNLNQKLSGMHGILVASGFGERGVHGKILAAQYAREHKLPFFGICLGMQMAIIEYARHVMGIKSAHTTELCPNTDEPVIDLMEDRKRLVTKGGTMRLGGYTCAISEGSLAHRIYGKTEICERHRHRYEVNSNYVELMETAGMRVSGTNPDTGLVEIIEIPEHPFFIGVQFHPELKSTPENPQPIFVAFVKAAKEYKVNNRNC
jgi:CTP synthase